MEAERTEGLDGHTGYAAGDRVQIIKKTIWGCQIGTVHWCNSQYMNVRLDNNKAILSLHVSDVKPHNAPASAAPNLEKDKQQKPSDSSPMAGWSESSIW